MSLKMMQGFETVVDDSDLRAQGWAPNPSKTTARNVLAVPSVTGVGGFSLRPLGPYNNPLSSTTWGSAAANDFGYFNTGITVNQAWLAGGVTFGFGIKFNSGVSASYGAGSSSNCGQACFDGTRYWAIRLVGATFNVAYSTDLQNWVVTATQPAAALWNQATISYVGGGVVAVISNNTTSAALIVYYTNNQGASWSTSTLETVGNAQSGSTGVCIATGNASFPHAVITCSSASTSINCGGVYVGTLGGTMTKVATATGASFTALARPRAISSLLVMPLGTNGNAIYSATAANASLNTTGAWSTATLGTSVIVNDIAYHPTSNLWVLATTTGIYTFVNTGAAGTPVAPTGAQTLTQRYSTVGMSNVHLVGTTLVATGLFGHIITSADGITWAESGGHLLPVGTSGVDWRSATYDGSRYVLFSDGTSGVVATTPDLQTNYAAQYVMEPAEVAQALSATVLGTGLIPGGAPSSTTGQWSMAGSSNPAMLQLGPVSSGSRPFILDAFNTAVSLLTGTISTVQLYHYIELKYIKATATANTFTVAMYVDGILIGTSAAIAYGSTGDTTSVLNIVFQRNGVFTAIDDIYVTLDDGVANTLQGPIGIINIIAQRPETDVQAQFVKSGSAASNSLSVNQPALSSGSANYVSSATAGDKDIYGTTDNLPAGYAPKAIQVEAYYTKTSTSAPVVNLGLVSGGAEVDGAQVTINSGTPVYVAQVFEKNPNGNVAWSASTVNAAQFVNNHVS